MVVGGSGGWGRLLVVQSTRMDDAPARTVVVLRGVQDILSGI